MAKGAGGRKSERGPRGFVGRRGTPGVKPDELRTIIEDIEKVQAEAALQFKRTAQIQMQLDATLKALKEMGDRAGLQRKRR